MSQTAVPVLQDRPTQLLSRWKDVRLDWAAYERQPDDFDAGMNFLIKLDSYGTLLKDLSLYMLLDAWHQMMRLGEELPSSEHQETLREELAKEMDLFSAQLSTVCDGMSTQQESYDSEFMRAPVDTPMAAHMTLLWKDAHEAHDVMAQLEHYGYLSHAWDDPRKALRHAIQMQSKAIAVDVDMLSADELTEFSMECGKRAIPWMAVPTLSSFDTQLRMLRLRALTVLQKPVTASLLVDALDKYRADETQEPSRVLLVNDDPSFSTWVSSLLSTLQVDVDVVTEPSQVLDILHARAPDLIFLDVRLKGCTGLELAEIIRQYDTFVGIPIVYLSSEDNAHIRHQALTTGADDYLTKPVAESHLLALVQSKVRRAKRLRQVMTQDRLTGLLHHTSLKQQLAQSLALTKREGRALSFAMLDIDHFKRVNDRYGHPVGDRVIKSLAKLLRSRVRQSDVVGRYGGEEFAVVLHGATPEAALKTLDRIRVDFSKIYHTYEDGLFACSFSCGIAGYPDFEDASLLASKADQALYASKSAGRNRVTIYGHPSTGGEELISPWEGDLELDVGEHPG